MTIRVAIDARLPESSVGGVQQVICSLAQGFSELSNPEIERYWIVYQRTNWWKSFIPPQDVILQVSPPGGLLGMKIANSLPKLVTFLNPLLSRFLSTSYPYDKLLKSKSVTIVHLPFQEGFHTRLPFIYHPHDLQHCYLPEFFNKRQIAHRDTIWAQKSAEARIVIAETSQVASDLIKHWSIDSGSIVIVPSPPPIRPSSINSNSNGRYLLYPAAFWPHKNHARLIESIAALRSKGIDVKLILTGAKIGVFPSVERLTRKLGVEDLVDFRGHISDQEFESVLKGSIALVVPTLFESLSLPIWEAQRLGIPVVCSNTGALPHQVGDSALTFDPLNVGEIASTILEIWSDEKIRQTLSSNALLRSKNFTSLVFSLAFNGLYKQISNIPKAPEEIDALEKLQSVVQP